MIYNWTDITKLTQREAIAVLNHNIRVLVEDVEWIIKRIKRLEELNKRT